MGRIGFPARRGVKRDAFALSKRRNAAAEPIRPTEGRDYFTPWRRCASLPMRGIAMRSAPDRGAK
jgi:hypothetical protein